MLIDLHCHSTASDGALAPTALLQRALEAGVGCLALTDHDTVAGCRELADAVVDVPTGFRLVTGVELSCQWAATTIHVVGLHMPLDHPALVEALRVLDGARERRAVTIAERLHRVGFPGGLEGAAAQAGTSQIGRPHFARWLLEAGHVADLNEAFDRYLGAGRTGDVKTFWPRLAEVVQWIVTAGGQAVLAHPLKYRFTASKLRRLLEDFVAAGGGALEVVSGRQSAEQTAQLGRLAGDYALRISAGSDFHQDWQYGPTLGVETTDLPDLPAVWDQAPLR